MSSRIFSVLKRDFIDTFVQNVVINEKFLFMGEIK